MFLLKRIGAIGMVLCLAMGAYAQRPERNSFLNDKITSVSTLIAKLKSDPILRDRFERHYAMSRGEIEAYFATFRLGKLKKTGVYRVFGVPEDGQIHSTPQRLKAGSLVFLDLEGVPVMRVYCGNPMTLGPSDPLATIVSDAEVIEQQEVTLKELEASEQPSSADLVAETADLEPTYSPVPEVEVVPSATPGTDTVPIDAPQIRIPGPSVNLGSFLPALLLLTPLPRNSPPPNLIPEPAAMIALCIGLGGLLMKRRQ